MNRLQLFSDALHISLSDNRGYYEQHGSFLQGESRLHIQIDYDCPGDAEVLRTTVTCGNVTAFGEDLTFALPDSGTVSVTVSVQLTNEQADSESFSIQVLAYSPPEVHITSLERCNSQGVPDPQGEMGLVTFDSTVWSLPWGNSAAYSLQYRAVGQEDWTNIALTKFAEGSLSGAQAMFPAAASHDYAVRLRVADALHLTLGNLRQLSVAFALADFSRADRAIGLGMRAGTENTLSVGLPMNTHGNAISGLPDPAENSEAVSLGYLRRSFWGPRLLWENPNPDATFGPTGISLSLGHFLFLAIEFHTGDNYYLQLHPKGRSSNLSVGSELRAIRSSDSGISFFSIKDNTHLIPTKIYGLQEAT